MDEVRSCMFCGARGLTKTHLIAQKAIRVHLPLSTHGVKRADSSIDIGGVFESRFRDFDTDPLSQQVKRACEPCNRDWMGGIENDVAADVIALAKGEQRTLDADRAERLAVWATTVAMLRSAQDSGVPALDFADARALRRSSALPAGYVVWLIAGEAKWDFPSRHQRIWVETDGLQPEPTHVTWFWIGKAVFMVTHPGIAFMLSRLNALGDAAQILAPHGDYPISWPRARSAPLSGLIALTSSFYRS